MPGPVSEKRAHTKSPSFQHLTTITPVSPIAWAAFTARFTNTCWSSTWLAFTMQPFWRSVCTSMLLKDVECRAIFIEVSITEARSTASPAVFCAEWEYSESSFTIFFAASEYTIISLMCDFIVSMSSSSIAASAMPSMPARGLFISCAMPEASVPMPASFSDWLSLNWSVFCSVMSLPTPTVPIIFPSLSTIVESVRITSYGLPDLETSLTSRFLISHGSSLLNLPSMPSFLSYSVS